MKIVIDARMLYWTGVGRYTKALLDELARLDTRNEYHVLVRPADKHLWQPVQDNFHRVDANIDPYSIAEQVTLPRLVKSLEPDLVHFTTPNAPMFYRGKSIVTVHDLTLLDYDTSRGKGLKRYVRGLKRYPFRVVFAHAVGYATGITTGTEYVRRQLVERFNVPPQRITVAPLAADPVLSEPAPIDRFGIGQEYLLYVNNFYPYKNAASTVLALKLLAEKYPKLQLVFTGKTDYFRDQLEKTVREQGLEKQVVFTGFVTDGELISLYRNARLFIYPSLSEGFGLQGLEAMTQGTPVLAADASCLPEVYGDAACYFDPHSPQDQADKIAGILADEALRERMIAAGRSRVKLYSWERTARLTLAAYENIGQA